MLLLLLDFDVNFAHSMIHCCGIIVALLWHYSGIAVRLYEGVVVSGSGPPPGDRIQYRQDLNR